MDPRPMAAFVEYTLKPLVEDAKDLLVDFKEAGVDLKEMKDFLIKLYFFEKTMTLLTNVAVTGLICLTIWYFLSTTT